MNAQRDGNIQLLSQDGYQQSKRNVPSSITATRAFTDNFLLVDGIAFAILEECAKFNPTQCAKLLNCTAELLEEVKYNDFDYASQVVHYSGMEITSYPVQHSEVLVLATQYLQRYDVGRDFSDSLSSMSIDLLQEYAAALYFSCLKNPSMKMPCAAQHSLSLKNTQLALSRAHLQQTKISQDQRAWNVLEVIAYCIMKDHLNMDLMDIRTRLNRNHLCPEAQDMFSFYSFHLLGQDYMTRRCSFAGVRALVKKYCESAIKRLVLLEKDVRANDPIRAAKRLYSKKFQILKEVSLQIPSSSSKCNRTIEEWTVIDAMIYLIAHEQQKLSFGTIIAQLSTPSYEFLKLEKPHFTSKHIFRAAEIRVADVLVKLRENHLEQLRSMMKHHGQETTTISGAGSIDALRHDAIAILRLQHDAASKPVESTSAQSHDSRTRSVPYVPASGRNLMAIGKHKRSQPRTSGSQVVSSVVRPRALPPHASLQPTNKLAETSSLFSDNEDAVVVKKEPPDIVPPAFVDLTLTDSETEEELLCKQLQVRGVATESLSPPEISAVLTAETYETLPETVTSQDILAQENSCIAHIPGVVTTPRSSVAVYTPLTTTSTLQGTLQGNQAQSDSTDISSNALRISNAMTHKMPSTQDRASLPAHVPVANSIIQALNQGTALKCSPSPKSFPTYDHTARGCANYGETHQSWPTFPVPVVEAAIPVKPASHPEADLVAKMEYSFNGLHPTPNMCRFCAKPYRETTLSDHELFACALNPRRQSNCELRQAKKQILDPLREFLIETGGEVLSSPQEEQGEFVTHINTEQGIKSSSTQTLESVRGEDDTESEKSEPLSRNTRRTKDNGGAQCCYCHEWFHPVYVKRHQLAGCPKISNYVREKMINEKVNKARGGRRKSDKTLVKTEQTKKAQSTTPKPPIMTAQTPLPELPTPQVGAERNTALVTHVLHTPQASAERNTALVINKRPATFDLIDTKRIRMTPDEQNIASSITEPAHHQHVATLMTPSNSRHSSPSPSPPSRFNSQDWQRVLNLVETVPTKTVELINKFASKYWHIHSASEIFETLLTSLESDDKQVNKNLLQAYIDASKGTQDEQDFLQHISPSIAARWLLLS